MSGQTWTPAPKRGVVPLHPLTFGTLLGRSFAILRHNPKVVFGFAVVVQLVIVLVSSALLAAVLVATIGRVTNVSPASPDFEPLLIGTIAINAVVAFAIGLASIAFTAILQGVVAAEVRSAAVGEKATLPELWRRMRPAFWRLFGFAMLQLLYVIAALAVAALFLLPVLLTGDVGGPLALSIVLIVLFGLGMIPLSIWLGTKLLLVPSILVFEHSGLRTALVRSWRLTRGRFWVAFGLMLLIGVIMGFASQIIAMPATLLSSLIIPIIAPTGGEDVATIVLTAVVGVLLPQILLLVLQTVSIVVQCTAAAFVYLDCRFRYEGLDQSLIAHLERRDLGWSAEQLGDPFAVDPARAVSSAPPPVQAPEYAAQPGWQTAPGYAPHPAAAPQPPYGQAPQPPYGQAPQPPYGQAPHPYAAPAYPPPPAPPAPSAPAVPSEQPPTDAPPTGTAPPTDTTWTPPNA